jgi:hypothetical protein
LQCLSTVSSTASLVYFASVTLLEYILWVTGVSRLLHHALRLLPAGVSAAMNELRPCAPLSLKVVLAQEVVKGLHAVSDSLVRYKAMRMLRGNESALFLSLCQAFIEVCLVFHDRPVVLNLIREHNLLQHT